MNYGDHSNYWTDLARETRTADELAVALYKKESDYEQLQRERDKLAAQVEELKEELLDCFIVNQCGCTHPACNNCQRDREYEAALNKTPSACL